MKTLRFPSTRFGGASPLWPLHGRLERPRPVLLVAVVGPGGTDAQRGLLDTGADDTVFSMATATAIGVDLAAAPTGSASGVGASAGALTYAEVLLRLTDGAVYCEWPARVAFTTAALKRPLLGFAGFLQFFKAVFDGEREEVELVTNGLYRGT